MLANIRTAISMLEPASLRRWLLHIPLGVAAAMLEMATAAAIFAIVAILNGNRTAADLPFVGPMLGLLPAGLVERDGGIRALLVATAVLVAAKLALQIAMTLFQTRWIARDRSNLSTRLYEAYLHAPYTFHLGRSVADSVHRIDEAVKIVFETVMGGAASLLQSGLMIAGLMAMLLWANPLATLTVGAGLAAWVIASVRATRRALIRLGDDTDAHLRERQRVMWEGLTAVREIKIFHRESHFRDRFAGLQEAMIDFYTRTGVLYALPQVLLEGVFSFGMLIATAVVLASDGGHATLPVLGLYAYVGVRLIPTANIVVVAASKIVAATVPLELLARDYELTRRLHGPTGAAAAATPRMPFRDRVEIRDVTFRYEEGATPALREVSLSIGRGESLALVGRNGAGKSTLMQILFGLLEPEEGAVFVDGQDIRTAMHAWQRILGYVPQDVHLIEDTVARNVAFGIPPAEIDRARVHEVLRSVRLDATIAALPDGIETVLGGRGVRLSGGQSQRLAIARTLYHDPDLLLLDEASSALDSRIEREVAEAIAGLAGSRTLVVIAHRALTIRRCDRVAMLREGEIVATGTYNELIESSEEFRDIIGAA